VFISLLGQLKRVIVTVCQGKVQWLCTTYFILSNTEILTVRNVPSVQLNSRQSFFFVSSYRVGNFLYSYIISYITTVFHLESKTVFSISHRFCSFSRECIFTFL